MPQNQQEPICIEINPSKMTDKDWDEFNAMMDKHHEELVNEIRRLAFELGVDEGCAADVLYLRGRSRHTSELEAELIRLHKAGTPPNICDFGHEFKNTPP